jgi:hypothetical protein
MTATFLADVIDRANVGVVERGCCLGLAAKALESVAVLGEIVGKELEGDKTSEARVLGLVDHTHPASAELLDDAVVRDSLIEQESPQPVIAMPRGANAKTREAGSQK